MTVAGIDIGTGGARAVLLDDGLELLARSSVELPPGRRIDDGGHLLDEAGIVAAVRAALTDVVVRAGRRPEALSVSATSGTLCFRDRDGTPAGEAVAYDDARHGAGLDRLAAWSSALPAAVRVLPLADAVLEALGADPGGTDWTNALKLGWDPAARSWPDRAPSLLGDGFLPEPVLPGTPAGRSSGAEPWGAALLVRGATDGCATQIATGRLQPSEWTISLGTTVTWKTVSPEPPPLPAGAYAHRLSEYVWLPGAASNSGGGVITADGGAPGAGGDAGGGVPAAGGNPGGRAPGAGSGTGGGMLGVPRTSPDLAALDRSAVLPSTFAAYPLARPGERFPVCDPGFAGFGLPPRDHPAFHSAVLEGVGYVIRLGIERLAGRGVPELDLIRFTGGGARSLTWMSVLASVLRRPVISAPGLDASLGAALIAAAGLRGQPAGTLEAAPSAVGPVREHTVDQGLRPSYAGGYSNFLGRLAELGLAP